MNQIEIYNKTSFNIVEADIKKLADQLLNTFKETNNFIEIIFTTKREIQTLNKEHRHIDRPTDVLSYPQAKAPTEIHILGSLVISPDVVEEKNENMDDVIKHGILHLLGFDHEENETKWQEAADQIDCKL